MRVKDLDFARRSILVRDGKGMEDRVTILPDSLLPPLQQHLQRVKRLHEQDVDNGYGAVHLPFALERKYPNANREWARMQSIRRQWASLRPGSLPILALGWCAAITWTRAVCKRRSGKLPVWLG